jgi:hypothetical protein|tara:strand:+ start:37843 stop:38955 length:1113 start_codon:yes stop_codon:yes gene_type:complete
MPDYQISKHIKWELTEQTTTHSTREGGWDLQREVMPANFFIGGHTYVVYAWANCFSPGTNDGGTKWAFVGGSDLPGSSQERYDTNSSGLAICHLGTFVAPDPALPIGLYRRVIEDGGQYELTKAGQTFVIDITDASNDTFPAYSISDTTNRVLGIGGTLQSLSPVMTGGPQCLVLASAKVYGGDGTPTKLGLYHDGSLVSSGSRYAVDLQDNNQVLLGGVYNFTSGEAFSIRNIDDSTSATTNYTCITVLNLGLGAAAAETGELSAWTDLGGSGSWSPTTTVSNSGPSFVFAFGRQEELGVGSGRPASISVKNNTQNVWYTFPSRPSGEFSPHYFPSTEVGSDVGQYSTAAVVGVTNTIASGDEIQVYTL